LQALNSLSKTQEDYMSRMIRTARGHEVDFDAILIKQQLAQAPMNIEVAQRKRFIDSKEEKPKRAAPIATMPIVPLDTGIVASPSEADFEPDASMPVAQGALEGPVPELPVRTKS
jgi:hypothetical protein